MLQQLEELKSKALQELDGVSDVVVQRFVQGRASPEELAQLQRGHVSAYNSAETESAARESHQ